MSSSSSASAAARCTQVRAVTMLCLLSGTDASGYSHEYISRCVLTWAAEKFPRLIPRDAPRNHSISADDGQACVLAQERGGPDLFTWVFRASHPEPGADRRWLTEVCLTHWEGQDLLGVRNSYEGSAPHGRATQPRFLRPLVDHLTYLDGGFRVGPRPLFARGPREFESFCDHLQALQRQLPLVVLAPCAGSGLQDVRYGTNPWTLAQ